MTVPSQPQRALAAHSDAHYLRLLVTPLAPAGQAEPIDRVSFVQLSTKIIADWFGAVGPGPGAGEVEVVHVAETGGANGSREVYIRVPKSTAHSAITALPLSNPAVNGQSYSIRVVHHADSLSRLAGPAGTAGAGWKAWTAGLQAQARAQT